MKAKSILCLTLGLTAVAYVQAKEPAQLLAEMAARAEVKECKAALNRPWATFSGPTSNYRELEQAHMQAAMYATRCAVQRGYGTYRLLGGIQEAKKAGVKGFDAALDRAASNLKQLEVGDFVEQVKCNATTPRITLSGESFSQTVDVSCSSPLGPVAVNLKTLHVTIAGRDLWNGPSGTYLGRKLSGF